MQIEVCIKKQLRNYVLDVDFVLDGEQFAILGASGSGKSMTLKCIAGIVTPDSGYIKIDGETVFDSEKKINVAPQKRKTAYFFQNYALFPHLTVLQNIELILGKEKDKAKGLLEKFSLSHLSGQRPAELSGGEQQRVAIVRILASSPKLILFDEPFSALDFAIKEELQEELMRYIKESKIPYVLVSHNQNEVYDMSKQIVVLYSGQSISTCSSEDLFESYSSVEEASLLGKRNIYKVKKHWVTDLGLTTDKPYVEIQWTSQERSFGIPVNYLHKQHHFGVNYQVYECTNGEGRMWVRDEEIVDMIYVDSYRGLEKRSKDESNRN